MAQEPQDLPIPGEHVAPERLLGRLFHCSVDGILAFDRRCCYTVWNPAMERISGVPSAEVLGRNAFDIFPFLREIGEDRFFDAALAGETAVAQDRPFVIPDTGKRGYFEGHYSPLRDESGTVIGGLGIIRDITERKRFESERFRSQRLESVGRLAGGVAHDFNNLLMAVTGWAELLQDRLVDQPELLAAALQIREAADRGAALTEQLLAFARKQVVRPRVVDVNRLVRKACDLLRRLIGEDIELRIDLAETPCTVLVDPGQFEQVLVNLAVNARDAMPAGGVLTIASVVGAPEELIGAAEDAPADWVVVTVEDTGVGMRPETQQFVFEPFFTTKPEGEGSGLGLAICFGIVSQARGHIDFSSEGGRGTRFRVALPLSPEPPRLADEPGASGVRRGTETILLVEDDDLVRAAIRSMLQAAGYSLREAANGRVALEILEHGGDRIDLIITDLVMPNMGGRELMERAAALGASRVLFISGYSAEFGTAEGALGEDVDFIQKPFSSRTLTEKVRAMLVAEDPATGPDSTGR